MSWKSNAKRIFVASLVLLPVAAMAAAGDQFQALEDSGASAKGAVQGAIKSVIWVISLLPVGIGAFAAMKMKEHLENKEEQNQHEPRWMKFGKIIFAFAGGVLITYILFGIIGKVFMDLTFADAWETFVTDFWKDVI